MTIKKSRTTKKVWRIYRFQQRFELPENIRKCRKSALEFTRDFVGEVGGNEAVSYQQQIRMIQNGDGLEFLQLFGFYRQLVNEAAKRSKAYRGYLLNSENEPLSESDIARIFKIHTKRLGLMLRKLESAQLLEHTNMPTRFDLSLDNIPKEKKKTRKRKSTKKSADGRKRAEKSADGQKSSKKDGNKETIVTKETLVTKETNGKGVSQGKGVREINNRQKAELNPPTTQPTMPKQTEAGGSVRQSTGPLGSVQKLGDVAKGIIVKLDPQANRFAQEIYAILKLPWPQDHQEYNREIGCFREQFHNAQRLGLPPPKIFDIGIVKARHVAKYNKNNKKPGAVWCTVFKKSLPSKRCKVM